MQNRKRYRRSLRIPTGAIIKEFWAWLRGLRAPKYIPQKIRHGNPHEKK